MIIFVIKMMTDKSLALFAEILCVCKAALTVNIKSRAKVVPINDGGMFDICR